MDTFGRQVRDALAHLYDPAVLRTHALTRFVTPSADHGKQAGIALAEALRTAIETIRPVGGTPSDPTAWRRYRGLVLRYIEALDAHAVQGMLAISQSTYYREHHQALETVVSVLRERWHVTSSAAALPGSRRSAGNIPTFLTRFVGRAIELAQIEEAIASARLVTLTGTGGCGKTRLALHVGSRQAEHEPGSVWIVELASLTDPALVPSTTAAALGVREEPSQPILETVLAALTTRQMLLILDNCEHLVDACARFADIVLRRCPGVHILATSREALGIEGEVTRPVRPLTVPPLVPLPSCGQMRTYEAVQLFLDRAVATQASFAMTERNLGAIARVCVHLDGIPLAIELAVARLNGLTVEQLAARLDQRFRLLTGGSRTGLPHHQTLRATIDWSYALLTDQERMLFDRLSVFAGGWMLEAAECVCGGIGLDRDDVLALLLRLVDQSLVVVDDAPGTPEGAAKRYRLLETLRDYAREKLCEREDADDVFGRYAAYYLARAEEAESHLLGPQQLPWLDRLTAEHDNLRASIQWLEDTGKVHDAVRLGGALHWFWYLRGHWAEERAWLARILTLRGIGDRTGPWAKVLIWAQSAAAGDQQTTDTARTLVEEALSVAREVDDRRIMAQALMMLANIDREQGNFASARQRYAESLQMYRVLNDQWGMSTTLSDLGRVLQRLGESEAARAVFEDALLCGRSSGDRRSLARALEYLAELAIGQGAVAEAHTVLEEAHDLYCELGDATGLAMTQKFFARLAYMQEDYELAGSRYRASLALLRERAHTFDSWLLVEPLEGLLAVAASLGDAGRAMRLAGVVSTLQRPGGFPSESAHRADVTSAVERACAKLGADIAAAESSAGQALSLSQALGYALDTRDDDAPLHQESNSTVAHGDDAVPVASI